MSSKNRERNGTHSIISSLLVGFKAHITVGGTMLATPLGEHKGEVGLQVGRSLLAWL